MPITTNAHEFQETLYTLGSDCAEYVAVTTAFNDNIRGVVDTPSGPKLSFFGPNITDARLRAKDGRVIPFVRPSNYDEKVGIISASNVFFMHDGNSVSVQTLLEDPMAYAKYTGVEKIDFKPHPNMKLIVRIQTGWIPMSKEEKNVEYAVEHFSYQTVDADDPRNFLFTGTNKGIFCHGDDVGSNILYAHTIGSDGEIQKHWFDASPSDVKVGGKHKDIGPSTISTNFGIGGDTPSNNQYMVLSVPNKQKPKSVCPLGYGGNGDDDDDDGGKPVYRSMGISMEANVEISEEVVGVQEERKLTFERPEGEYPVLTLLLFNTVRAQGDDVSVSVTGCDLANAVRGMNNKYELCDKVCKMSQLSAMLSKWTKEDQLKLKDDLATIAKTKFDPFEPTVDAMMLTRK